MKTEGITKSIEDINKRNADKGNAEAAYEYGLSRHLAKDFAAAFRYYERALQGHSRDRYPLAHNHLGLIRQTGSHGARDFKEAAHHFASAAELGLKEAQYNLGLLYFHGKGVPQDYEEARHWFEKAELQDHSRAAYELGIMYENGYGVSKDFAKAASYFKRAWRPIGLVQTHEDQINEKHRFCEPWGASGQISGYQTTEILIGPAKLIADAHTHPDVPSLKDWSEGRLNKLLKHAKMIANKP